MRQKKFAQPMLFIGLVLFVFIASYGVVYRPLNSELKTLTYDNFQTIASQKELRVEQFIDRSIEAADGLSNHMMMRDAIIDYHDGEITFNELSDYTQPLYDDGAKAISNTMTATRIVDGDVVANVNGLPPSKDLEGIKTLTQTHFNVRAMDDEVHVIVSAPIRDEQAIIAQDVVVFDMTPLVKTFKDNGMAFSVLYNQDHSVITSGGHIITNHEEYTVFIKDEVVIYLSHGLLHSQSTDITVMISQNTLESDIQALTQRALFWTSGLFVTSFVVIIVFTRWSDANELKNAKTRRKYFEEMANTDALTNVYTRHFLKYWQIQLKKNFDETLSPIAVVMSDVNHFKIYNDEHGHKAGDAALISIATIIKESIRDDDLLIRFGGDEFLLIFLNCGETLCKTIMERINNKVITDERLPNLALAYGWEILSSPEAIDDAIEIADQKMYKHKRMLDT